MVEKFKAFVVDQDDNGIVSNSYKELTKDDLPEGRFNKSTLFWHKL